MAQVTLDNYEWIHIEHEGIIFQFKKIDADAGTVRFRFAKSSLGGANSDRTSQFEFGGGPDEGPIPEGVMAVLRAEGFQHL